MIKLIAIDLDGTLFDNESQVSAENAAAIRRYYEAGYYPVVSTGRPLKGIPENVRALPFTHAITCNGGGVYDLKSKELIYENAMEPELVIPIMEYIDTKYVHMDAFLNGDAMSTFRCYEIAQKLPMPEALRRYIIDTRSRVASLEEYVLDGPKRVQKVTLNFVKDADGNFVDREEIRLYLEKHPGVDVVCGGYHNLEFTKKGVNKGIGLHKLAEHLGLAMEETCAIGDTENDYSIIKEAGVGVAMGNSIPMVLEIADYVTASNTDNGVAAAIDHFMALE